MTLKQISLLISLIILIMIIGKNYNNNALPQKLGNVPVIKYIDEKFEFLNGK